MLLDAPSYKTNLTAEAALGIIQKTIHSKGYKEYEVSDFKLVYTPYYYFSFDVLAESGQSPSGKTALNAYNGDLNDFIPYLMDRPLKKVKETEGKAEVEPTAISEKEAKETAAAKLASHVGLKKDSIHVSAVSKLYIPTYRVWVTVAGDERKVEVDALMGAPTGLDDLPEVTKSFDQSVKTVLEKMKSPQGWMDLFKNIGGIFAPGGSPLVKYGVLAVVILVLIFLIGRNQGILGGSSVLTCAPDEEFLGTPSFLGLFGERPVLPAISSNRTFFVRGTCLFENKGQKEIPLVVARVIIKRGDVILALDNPAVRSLVPGTVPSEKRFNLSWQEDTLYPVKFEYEKGI